MSYSIGYKQPLSRQWWEAAYKGAYIPCKAQHPHSCEYDAFIKFKTVFQMAIKLYIPIHGLPTLIFKSRRLKTEPFKILYNLFKNIVKSSLFLSLYVSVFWYFTCIFKKMRHKVDHWNVIMASFICSFACLLEPQNRRVELALFMFPRFIEQMWYTLEKRGYVKSIKNGEVLVFAASMSLLMYNYQNEPGNIKSTYQSMFNKFFGDN